MSRAIHYALKASTRHAPVTACGESIRPTGAPSTTRDPALVTCKRCEGPALREALASCVAAHAALVAAVRTIRTDPSPSLALATVFEALVDLDAARPTVPTLTTPRTARLLRRALDALDPRPCRGLPGAGDEPSEHEWCGALAGVDVCARCGDRRPAQLPPAVRVDR